HLWTERYSTSSWNARVKDDLEELLPRLICRGQVDLTTAQREIAENWIAAYKKYFKSERPVRTPVDLLEDAKSQPGTSARVDADLFGALSVMSRLGVVSSRPSHSAGVDGDQF